MVSGATRRPLRPVFEPDEDRNNVPAALAAPIKIGLRPVFGPDQRQQLSQRVDRDY